MKYPKLLLWIVVGLVIGFAASWFIAASWKHLIFTAVFALFIAVGFDTVRPRPWWARIIFSIADVIGVAYTITVFLVDSHAVAFSRRDISVVLAIARGLVLGLIIALMVSGQLLGRKQGRTA